MTYNTSQVLDLVCDSSKSLSSSDESDTEYDLSDPEAECSGCDSPATLAVLDVDSDVSDVQSIFPHGDHYSDSDSSDTEDSGNTKRICKSTRGRVSRSSFNRGRGKGRTGQRKANKGSGNNFEVHDLSEVDNGIRQYHDFQPSRSVGVQNVPSNFEELTPADLFKLYFDSAIVDVICSASNEYAERNKSNYPTMYAYFREMTPDNFYKVIGILIHLGYRKIPRPRLLWSPISLCFDPLVSQVLSRNKFESLLTFLHLVHEDTEKKLKEEGDKLHKVRPLYDYLSKRCEELYQPHREVSIDERMVRSKARFSFRQYIRNKPTKWGFKLWCMCDSHNGYTCAFSVYRGKHGEVRSENGLGYDVVMSLIKPYYLQGYSLYLDNFYHIFLDPKRKGVPSEISSLKKNLAKSNVLRGEGAYIRDDVCSYSVWKDTKCVAVMSSEYPGHSETTVVRNVKNKDGKNEKKDVPIPSAIYNYNRFMNGVDRSDQLINYYNVLRQTKKYWKTLFFHFIDIAVVNAYIIYKDLNLIEKDRMSHLIFRETIVRQLCDIQITVHQSVAGKKPASISQHSSLKMKKPKDCVYCRIVYQKRRRTTRRCYKCDAALCLQARNCFRKFHQARFDEIRNEWLRTKPVPPISTSSEPRGRPVGSTISKGRGKRKCRNW